jgi:hypothetical protein
MHTHWLNIRLSKWDKRSYLDGPIPTGTRGGAVVTRSWWGQPPHLNPRPPPSLAILVENFVILSKQAADEARQKQIREAKAGRQIKYTLDPLLRYLTMHYTDDADLSDRLQRLFKVAKGMGCRWWPNSSSPFNLCLCPLVALFVCSSVSYCIPISLFLPLILPPCICLFLSLVTCSRVSVFLTLSRIPPTT